MTFSVEKGCVRSERLVGYFYSTHPLDVAYLTGAVHVQFMASHAFQLQRTPARLTILTLLFKVSATVTDYRGHRRTPLPACPGLSPCSSCAPELLEIPVKDDIVVENLAKN